MYNAQTLQQKFLGLVGFTQYNDPSYPVLPASLLQSSSRIFIQTVHPLCYLETIFNCAPEFSKFQYPAWAAGNYNAGSIITHADTLYIATTAASAGDVPGVAGMWQETDPFGAWLQSIYNASIIEMMADFIRARALDNANRGLLDSQILFDGIGLYSDRIIKSGRFVGLALTVNNQQGLQATIERLGAQFDTAQDLTLYLYHSSVREPLLTFDINVAKASSFNWQQPEAELILKFYDDTHNAGGYFFLGYYEGDLSGQAIRFDYNFYSGPCVGCNPYNTQAYNKWSRYVKINSFSVPASALDDDRNLFDINRVQWGGDGNYGLNLAVSVECDMTEFFGVHKMQFAQALAMKICLKLLAVIAYSTRMTAVEDKTRALAFSDLSEKDTDSFLNQYKNELKALSVDFSGMSSDCMPCTNKRGVINMGAV